MDEQKELELVVVESRINIGGVARLHNNTLNEIGVSAGEYIVIRSGKHSIIARAFGDVIIAEGEISLRKKDRKKLNAKEGDYVFVSKYVSLKNMMKSRIGRLWHK